MCSSDLVATLVADPRPVDGRVVQRSDARDALVLPLVQRLEFPFRPAVPDLHRAAKPMAPAGEAVRKLIQLREDLSSAVRGKRKVSISKNVKKFLYTREKE